MANYQADDMDLPNTQIVDDRVLKDVVAYVEVRSTNDNRTNAICKELENLGAKIKKTFTDDVTHVVYKEGCKRTRTKAQKRGVFLVSVLWVDSCKQNQEHVSERLYPASLPDDKSTPVVLTKLKKMKSMQPRDFDEDVANSAERCTKRKRKVDLLKMSKDTTPCNSPGLGGILVLETQPRSPEEIPTPLRLTIPDTPPSMRAKMKDLELKRNNGTSLSDLSLNKEAENTPRHEPLIRKLFSMDINELNMDVEEEDPLSVLNRAKSTGKAVDDGSNTQTAATLETLETPKLPSTERTNNRRKSMPSVKLSGNDYVDLPTRSSRRRKSLVVTSVSLDRNITEGSSDIPTNITDNSNIGQIDIVPVRTGENLSDCTGRKSSEILLKEPGLGNSKKTVKGRRKSLVSKSNTNKPVVENVSCIKDGKSDTTSSDKVTSRGGRASRGRGRTSEPSPDRVTRKGGGGSSGKISGPSLVKGDMTRGGASRRRSRVSDTSREAVTSGSRAVDPASRRGQRKSVTFATAQDSVINQDNQSTIRELSESEQQYSASKTDTVSASVTAIGNSDNLSSQTDICEQISTRVPDVEEGSSDESEGNEYPPLTGNDSTRAKFQAQRKQIPTKKIKTLLSQDNLPSSFLIEPTMKSDKIQPTILDTCSTESGNVIRKGRKRKVTIDDGDKESCKKSRKGSRSDPMHPQTNDMFSGSEESDKTESFNAPVKNIMRDILENDSSLSASNIQTESTLQTTGQHGMSLSTVFGDDTMASSISGFAPPRPSIDEFNLKIKSCRKPRKKAFSESSVSQRKQKFSDSDKSSSDSDGTGKSRSKFHGNVGSSFRHSPHRPSVVMTSLHSHEQDTVISIVKMIGQFVISDNVSDTTSHVICGGPRRTLNLLYAVSRGCWILHQKWVYDSLDAGHWLPEEAYEVTNWFPSVKTARLQKESLKENYKSTLFSGVGIMFVSQKTSPPRSHLAALIKLCGGQVTMSTSKAQIIVGNDFYPDRTSVSPLWILDCIIQQRLEPMEAYLQGRPKRDSSPEF